MSARLPAWGCVSASSVNHATATTACWATRSCPALRTCEDCTPSRAHMRHASRSPEYSAIYALPPLAAAACSLGHPVLSITLRLTVSVMLQVQLQVVRHVYRSVRRSVIRAWCVRLPVTS